MIAATAPDRAHGNRARPRRSVVAQRITTLIEPPTPMAIVKKSTHDRIEGTAKQARGKVKIAAGKITGSTRLQLKGHADVIVGKAQKKAGDLAKRSGR